NAALLQAKAQRIAVVAAVQNQALNFIAQRLGHGVQSRFQQFYLRWRCAAQRGCQRNSRAIDHHHPLASLTLLGAADSSAPFLAGAKEPSAKVSSHSKWLASSSSAMKLCHTLSQTPCSSQSRKRRQQVLGEGYCGGKSRQRAPVFKTHKIPSITARLSAGGRPPLAPGFDCGSNGLILSHCFSLNNDSTRRIHSSQTNPRF